MPSLAVGRALLGLLALLADAVAAAGQVPLGGVRDHTVGAAVLAGLTALADTVTAEAVRVLSGRACRVAYPICAAFGRGRVHQVLQRRSRLYQPKPIGRVTAGRRPDPGHWPAWPGVFRRWSRKGLSSTARPPPQSRGQSRRTCLTTSLSAGIWDKQAVHRTIIAELVGHQILPVCLADRQGNDVGGDAAIKRQRPIMYARFVVVNDRGCPA